jgi:hypothetical protein
MHNYHNKRLTLLSNDIPKYVADYFYCCYNELKSLQYAPKYVGGNFWSGKNNLTSLQYAPKYVGGDFDCQYNNLTSLQGAPKYVGGNFWCGNNPKKFTEEEVRAVCNAKGNIYV